MQYAVDLDGCHRSTWQGRKQNSAQGVTERCPIASLQRLHDKLAVGTVLAYGHRLDLWLFDFDHSITLPWKRRTTLVSISTNQVVCLSFSTIIHMQKLMYTTSVS